MLLTEQSAPVAHPRVFIRLPDSMGNNFAVYEKRQEWQAILVLQEYVSVFTWSMILTSERSDYLRASLVMLIQDVIQLNGPNAIVRADNPPGFKNLVDDAYLKERRISNDLDNVKNINKIPAAEREIQKLEHEIIHAHRAPALSSLVMLHNATAPMNCRIRTDGHSAR